MKKLLLLALLALLALLPACGKSTPPRPEATITFANGTVLHAELYDDLSPNTVANFIALAEKGFYNGTFVYRKKQETIILCGSKNADGTGGPGYTIKGEFKKNGLDNNTPFYPGTLFMERAGGYDSATCCFGIIADYRADLATSYAPLGIVLEEELDILKKLFDFDTDISGTPLNEIKIATITIDKKGRDFPEPVVKPDR